jgi:hypothetical protein
MFSMAHRTAPGSRGHSWFFQVRIRYLDNQDSKITLLLGLSLLMDILSGAINGFALHPLDKRSSLHDLTINIIGDGFPALVVLAFKYFLVRDKSNRAAQQTVPLSCQPFPHRYNDEEEYRPPTAMWGVIRVTGNGNLKEACKALAWDMIDSGLQVQWKEHQSAESEAQVLLINVPPVLDRGGVESKIIWHLSKIEKHFSQEGNSSNQVHWRSASHDQGLVKGK